MASVLRITRGALLTFIALESIYLLLALYNLAEIQKECPNVGRPYIPDIRSTRKTGTAPVPPKLWIITPTYKRNTQIADMTRLAQTLMLIPNLHWIVVEDAEKTCHLLWELLNRTAIPFTHLAAPQPEEYKNETFIGRGVFNRRAGLEWLRENANEGVLYFADDDNTYDLRIFEQMRYISKTAVFPVGMILSFGISSPIVRNGKVVGFHDAFQAGRKFAVDMAGFAVNLRVIHANPEATIPTRVSYLEDGFLRKLRLELEDLEPLANECTEVLVWHTRTNRPATPTMERIPHAEYDTNLMTLYKNILR